MPRYSVMPRQVHAVIHDESGVVYSTHPTHAAAARARDGQEFRLEQQTLYDVVYDTPDGQVVYDTHADRAEAEQCARDVGDQVEASERQAQADAAERARRGEPARS